jgi:hypothetical protein
MMRMKNSTTKNGNARGITKNVDGHSERRRRHIWTRKTLISSVKPILNGIARQQPRQVLQFPFFLMLYNLPDYVRSPN